MVKKSQEQRMYEIEQTFYKYYLKTPKSIRKITRPLMKTGVRAGKRLGPYTKQARSQADVWIDTNVKSVANKYLGTGKRIVSSVASAYGSKKKKK
jgi:hypothetical protein